MRYHLLNQMIVPKPENPGCITGGSECITAESMSSFGIAHNRRIYQWYWDSALLNFQCQWQILTLTLTLWHFILSYLIHLWYKKILLMPWHFISRFTLKDVSNVFPLQESTNLGEIFYPKFKVIDPTISCLLELWLGGGGAARTWKGENHFSAALPLSQKHQSRFSDSVSKDLEAGK